MTVPGGEAFGGGGVSHEDGTLMNGDQRALRAFFQSLLFTIEGHNMKTAIYKPGSGVSPNIEYLTP